MSPREALSKANEPITLDQVGTWWKIAVAAFVAAGLVYELRDHEARITKMEPILDEVRTGVHYLVCEHNPKAPKCAVEAP